MKIETMANLGDELYFLTKPEWNNTNFFTLENKKVEEINIRIDEEKVYEIYSPKKYHNGYYINDGEHSRVFIKKEDAEEKLKILNNEIKEEIKQSKKWEKEWATERGKKEIEKIAKKNNLKVTIN